MPDPIPQDRAAFRSELRKAAYDLPPPSAATDLDTAEAEALAEWHAWWLPQWVAVSEGFCPTHRVPLEPVTCAPGWAGGHCAQCRAYWGDDLENKSVRWTRDHQPYGDRRPVRPEWVLS